MKGTGGASELLLAFIFTLMTLGAIAVRAPLFITGFGALITSAIWIDGTFNWFNDWFDYQTRQAEHQHKELMELMERQHRETINYFIGELRRIYPPPPEPPPPPPPSDPGIQKLPPRNS